MPAVMTRVATFAVLMMLNDHTTVGAAGGAVTPVGKVINLLKGLVQEVKDEGKREASTYEKFSCFCKDSSESKANDITKGADKIDGLSADIEAKSAEKKEKQESISERTGKQESQSAELDEEKARCLKEEHTYDSRSMELTKAVSGIGAAIKSLSASKQGAASASLLYLHGSVRESLELAQTLDMVHGSAQADVKAFLQQDSSEDPGDYKFHSGGILAIMEMLKTNYGHKKDELDGEWTKTDAACTQTEKTLRKDLKNNKDAISKLSEKVEGLGGQIAKHKEDLTSEQTALKDAEGYLKDLTSRCEARSKDWDQRTKTRGEEVDTLTEALDIVSGKVKDNDSAANKRALLLSARRPVVVKAHASPRTALTSTVVTTGESDSSEIATELTALEGDDSKVQTAPAANMPNGDSENDVAAWLHGGAASFLQIKAATAESRRQEEVLTFVQQEGRRLGSASLASLALRMGSSTGNPFGKVKGLIQQLLERLLDESAGEATKKGFCDEQLGKTNQAREYSMEEANKLNAEVKQLEVSKEGLDTEVSELKDRIGDLKKELGEAKTLREQEGNDNVEALEKAKEGLDAVNDAYTLLKSFYKKAGAASLLQASPVDEDAPDAPTGDYKGKQGAASGVLGLLQVIISDFERTLKNTGAAEKSGAAEFEEMKQNFEAEVAGHETKVSLDIQDAKTTKATIKRKLKDMKFAMESVDAHSKTLEDLKPTCQGSGRMSFKERTQKREAEMAALKSALCKLDTDGVEADCK